MALETVEEVIVKKVRYPGAQFTPRDTFDLACAFEARPEIAVVLAEETPDALPRLGIALEILVRGGREAIAAQVRPTEAYRRFLDDALDRAKEGVAAARSIAEHPMPSNLP